MATRILLQHQTRYSYDRPVFLSPHFLRLKPAAHAPVLVEAYSLQVTPSTQLIHWHQDPFGNFIARLDFNQSITELRLDVTILMTLNAINPFDFFIDEYAQFFPFDYETQLKSDLFPYLEIVDKGPLMMQWLKGLDQSTQDIISFLVRINRKVYDQMKYTIRMEPGVQSSEESLRTAAGSCRDSAWLLVQLLRNLGLASRFVSGYLVQLSANPTGLENENNVSLHAWAETYIPGAGWIGLDPTGGLLTTEGHIPLACTPRPENAAPVSGTTDVANTEFSYTSSIVRF